MAFYCCRDQTVRYNRPWRQLLQPNGKPDGRTRQHLLRLFAQGISRVKREGRGVHLHVPARTLTDSAAPVRWHLVLRPVVEQGQLLGVVCRLRRVCSWAGFLHQTTLAPWWLPEPAHEGQEATGAGHSSQSKGDSTTLPSMVEAANGALHPADRSHFWQAWAVAREHRQPFVSKCRLRTHQGAYHWHSVTAVPKFHSDGSICGWLGRSQDRQRAHEAQSKRQELLSMRRNFLRVASHELNTPLTSLTLNLQLLLNRLGSAAATQPPGLTQATQRLASRALEQAQRLGATVNDLLDVKRIHTGKLPLSLSLVNLADLLRDTLDFLSPMLEEAGCQVQLEVQEGLCGDWDPARMQQVFFHLLTNVAKFAPHSHLRLIGRKDAQNVHISISDDGPGIPQQAHKQVFAMFGRACDVRGTSGLGLGLYLCRHIVHAHGGSLRLMRQGPRGAHFCMSLPLAPRAAGCKKDLAMAQKTFLSDMTRRKASCKHKL